LREPLDGEDNRCSIHSYQLIRLLTRAAQ
jgi:hypothetical protein